MQSFSLIGLENTATHFQKASNFLKVTALLLTMTSAQAQVATLDSRKILATMPVFAKVDTLVQEESGKYAQDYAKKRYTTQILLGIADSLYRVQPKAKHTEQAISAAQRAQQDFSEYEKKVQQKLAEYRSLILTPYYEKVNTAVKAVVQRLKYTQVMDIQQVAFVYIDPHSDITDEVIKQLRP